MNHLANRRAEGDIAPIVFPLGKPIALMILIALLSGAALLLRPIEPDTDLVVWVFSPQDQEVFTRSTADGPSLVERFEARTGRSVRIELVSSQAIDTRLLSLIMSGKRGKGVPDLVELEIGSVGKFLRAPVGQIGLVPLNPFLEQSDITLLENRLSAWSKNGTVFAAPLDVHPVTITYRKDLFDMAGITLDEAATWAAFQERCLDAQQAWGNGRYAIELPRSSADALYLMLLQRGINILDDRNTVHLAETRVARTVAFYAQLVAGPRRIAADVSSGEATWAVGLARGAVGAALTPDWRITPLKTYAPGLAGHVRMMALPRFDPTDAPTATWGGTAIAIPRGARDPAASWDLLQALCLSETALWTRWEGTGIVPATVDEPPWTPSGDPYFAGQSVQRLYATLARLAPARHVTPYTTLTMQALGKVVSKAADHVDRHGMEGLEEACRGWLTAAQRDIERFIAFGQMEERP